jgi:formyl-CoA transferase
LVPIDDPEIGATHTVSSPLQVVGVSKAKPSRAPRLGEHSTDILQELGFAAPEVASLLSAGAVSQSCNKSQSEY